MVVAVLSDPAATFLLTSTTEREKTPMTLSPEMTSSADDLFDSISPIDRDQPWGRPLLVPGRPMEMMPLRGRKTKRNPEGITEDGKVPYTRASSFGNYVADHTALEVWKRRSLTYGLAQREDLAAKAASCPPIIANIKNKDTLTKSEKDIDRLTNAVLDEVAEAAEIYANRDFKADWGTAIHGFTDPGPHGDIPARMRPDVQSWEATTARWRFFATEVFVANDELQVAGTFDHIVEVPHVPDFVTGPPIFMVDKKTGLLHPDGFSIQQSAYRGGQVYDGYTNTRLPLESLTGGAEINEDWAIIAHIPLGMGHTQIYFVDLREGRRGCRIAADVRAFRSDSKGFMHAADLLQIERLVYAGRVTAAATFYELKAVREEGIKDGVWVPELNALALARRTELTSS